ncbi:MAG: hypothetical protein JOZ38_09295 [Candidatus Eremiobacteraeota bacterium]|nr:hypothetical protein [Candidatus Eremiobacteraeota bacterium]
MLSYFLTLALSPSLPQEGTYRYKALAGNATVATAQVTIKHTATGLALSEFGTLISEGGNVDYSSTLTLPPSLVVSSYTAKYKQREEVEAAAVDITDASASMTINRTVTVVSLEPGTKAYVVLDSGPVSGYFVLPAEVRALANANLTAISPLAGNTQSLLPITGDDATRPATVPAGDAHLAIGGQVPFVLWYDPVTGVLDEVDVPGRGVVVSRVK